MVAAGQRNCPKERGFEDISRHSGEGRFAKALRPGKVGCRLELGQVPPRVVWAIAVAGKGDDQYGALESLSARKAQSRIVNGRISKYALRNNWQRLEVYWGGLKQPRTYKGWGSDDPQGTPRWGVGQEGVSRQPCSLRLRVSSRWPSGAVDAAFVLWAASPAAGFHGRHEGVQLAIQSILAPNVARRRRRQGARRE